MAIDKQIGYPDYLSSDNNTKLENDFAKVRYTKRLIVTRSSEYFFCFANYLVHIQLILYI